MNIHEVISPNTVTLWHGGRRLEYSYREVRGNNSKQMEAGPGLYLTNEYSVASKYAKGGGKTYLVTIEHGTDIMDINIPVQVALSFLNSIRMPHKKELLTHIKVQYSDTICLGYVNNLLINFNCLQASNSASIRQWFVDLGADYSATTLWGMKMVVVFTPDIIKHVEVVPANAVEPDQFTMPIDWKIS